MHGIGGSSSGAIAAFTVAWERPNAFPQGAEQCRQLRRTCAAGMSIPSGCWRARRSRSACSSATGGTTTAASRDGVYDEKRDWFYQNVRLMKALTQKGYDVNYSWGMNLHGQKFGGAIMPEMMRWLWRDGPVSTDPNDMVERGFRQPAAKKTAPAPEKQ